MLHFDCNQLDQFCFRSTVRKCRLQEMCELHSIQILTPQLSENIYCILKPNSEKEPSIAVKRDNIEQDNWFE